MKPEVKCPAAEDVHPVLSPNAVDVVCRIQGGLRPASDPDGSPAVCCANYAGCRIWRTAWEIDHGPSTGLQRAAVRAPLHQHTLKNATRDTVEIS